MRKARVLVVDDNEHNREYARQVLAGHWIVEVAEDGNKALESVRASSPDLVVLDLSMPLLSDPDRTVIEGWGVWQEKKNYGRTYMGIIRSTFLFDAEGTLVEAWRKVRVKGHADAVLERARSLTEA